MLWNLTLPFHNSSLLPSQCPSLPFTRDRLASSRCPLSQALSFSRTLKMTKRFFVPNLLLQSQSAIPMLSSMTLPFHNSSLLPSQCPSLPFTRDRLASSRCPLSQALSFSRTFKMTNGPLFQPFRYRRKAPYQIPSQMSLKYHNS